MVLTVPVQVWTRSLHHETVAVHAHARCFCGNQKHQNRFLWACSPCTLTCQLYRFINSSFVLTVLSLNFSIAHDRRMGVKGCFFTYVIKYIYHVHEDLLLSYFLSSTPLFHFSTSFIFAFAVSLFTPHPHPLIACSLYLTINLSPPSPVFTVATKMMMMWRFMIMTTMVLMPRQESATLARHAGPVRRYAKLLSGFVWVVFLFCLTLWSMLKNKYV